MKKHIGILFLTVAVLLTACGNQTISDKNAEKTISTEEQNKKTEIADADILETAESSTVEPVAIENLKIFESTYDDMLSFGEPSNVTPIDEESVVVNKGHYAIAEYEGLWITFSVEDDFSLVPTSTIVAITALSDKYTDSNGFKIGTTKEELMQKYSINDDDFLSEENEQMYRIKDDTLLAHDIPEYDSFYPADTGESPIILIYLIKDNCINGILLRHLTTG